MASPVDTSVKFFNEGMPGAPVLNGVAGSLIGVLDVCLCTGFGLRSATSLVVSGGIATLTLPSDAKNVALLDSVILIEGSNIAALNGEQKVTVATDVLLKFATTAADGTASGTITVKTAPAGWQKVFSGTNKAAYKSLSPQSLGMYLWVNDTGTLAANVRGYESMSSLDVGSGLFPTSAESAGGGFWAKSSVGSATANRWDLVADERLFYWCPSSYSGANPASSGQGAYWFGDLLGYKSGDAFAVSIGSANASPGGTASLGNVFFGGQATTSGMCRFARSYAGLGTSVTAYAYPTTGAATGSYSGADSFMGVFPAPTDGGLRLAKIVATENAMGTPATVLRGEMPGAYYAPQSDLYRAFARGDTVAVGGKKLYVVQCGQNFGDTQIVSTAGRGFFDITGPWR